MTFSELRTRVMAYSGERDATKCGYAVNDALTMMYNAIRWPFLRVDGTPLTMVANTQRYALPSNFKFPNAFWYVNTKVGTPTYLGGSTRNLDKIDNGIPQKYRILKAAAPSGSPITRAAWFVDFEYIPNASFISQYPTMSFDYYYKPADLSADADEPQLDPADHPIIVWGAVTLLTAKQNDQGGFQMFVKMWQEGYRDMIQNAIDFYGQNVVVPAGTDITEAETISYLDYGRPR